MESYDQLLEECKEVARDAEDVEAVERWLDCPADVEFICNACHEYLGGCLLRWVARQSISTHAGSRWRVSGLRTE